MAALAIAAGTFAASTTVTVRPYGGDDRMLRKTMPALAAITSGAAGANGDCTLSHASILAGQPVEASGNGPDGQLRRVFAYGS